MPNPHPTARRIVMMFDFDEYDLLTIFVVSVVVMFAASEIGCRFGGFARGRGRDNDATLEAAVLGLLALMISFSFAMALSLFEARRDAVLSEANAIGTTALRARLLPAPHDAQTVKLLREYVQIRLDLFRQAPTALELDAATDRSNAIQTSLGAARLRRYKLAGVTRSETRSYHNQRSSYIFSMQHSTRFF
jgi:hypothetical protein